MKERGRGRLRHVSALIAVAAYAGLSHYVNATGSSPALGAALALMPAALTAVVTIRRWGARAPVAVAVAAAFTASLICWFWPLLAQHYGWIAFAQDTGLYLLLGATFGRSLQGQRIPVCTRLADRMHGPLNPAEMTYTRRLTAAWAGFFGMLAALSTALFLLAPLRMWSLYANIGVLPLIGVMFAGEYLLRSRLFPKTHRGLLSSARSCFGNFRTS